MSDDSLLFTHAAEALLAGEIICFHRTPELHVFLSEGANELAMGDFLRKIGRRLSKTSDDASWFAVYRNLDSDGIRRAIGRQFGEVINNLEPLVVWLQMSGAFGSKGRPLQTGDSLKTRPGPSCSIREELVDALHRLDAMLFAFRTQQRQGRIVRAFALKYQREPGFRPSNYAAQTRIPPILNQVEAIPLSGHADLDSNKDEVLLTK